MKSNFRQGCTFSEENFEYHGHKVLCRLSEMDNDNVSEIFSIMESDRGRVDGVMDTSGQGWLPVNIFVVVNGVGVEFLNVILEIGVRFQMRC
ncbi:hypothetical protein OUZ56_009823 [Daphnia magna]|uniref:Uncharacterized protein n=1 Tax=Daphnia magna TaxID=35525 RepID=A0ABR0AH28_9CRUS|nr:hypothetical protein OUZ56_009823 [Daphnia magna]